MQKFWRGPSKLTFYLAVFTNFVWSILTGKMAAPDHGSYYQVSFLDFAVARQVFIPLKYCSVSVLCCNWLDGCLIRGCLPSEICWLPFHKHTQLPTPVSREWIQSVHIQFSWQVGQTAPEHYLYSSPSILQPSVLRPPFVIRSLDLVPKGNFLC